MRKGSWDFHRMLISIHFEKFKVLQFPSSKAVAVIFSTLYTIRILSFTINTSNKNIPSCLHPNETALNFEEFNHSLSRSVSETDNSTQLSFDSFSILESS